MSDHVIGIDLARGQDYTAVSVFDPEDGSVYFLYFEPQSYEFDEDDTIRLHGVGVENGR